MASSDVAWVDVLPSLRQFVPTLTRELGGTMPRAGQQAGSQFSQGFTRASVSGVDAATAKLTAARRKEEDAAGRVRVAEAKLQDLRDKGITSGARLVTAEENLAKAQRGLDDTQGLVTRSTRDLEAAQGEARTSTGELDQAMNNAEKTSGRFTTGFQAAATAIVAVGAVAVGAGKLLYDVGGTFDDVTDGIRVGTGATGQALEDLTESAKNVGKVTPAEFEAIGATIAAVNQRLGLTGPTLETLTRQILEVGRMTGEEVDVDQLSAAFSAFNVTGDETTAVMDQLFQVAQATGIGINELAAGAVKGGPQLQQFGFSIGESAVLLGSLDKAGLDSDRTVAALSRAMVQFSKDGKDPQEALQATIAEIDRLTASGQDAAAIDLASTVFGTRGAGQFVEAVKSGTVNVEALTAAAGQSTDTVLGVAEETKDFTERWQEFKNRVLVWLEPVASRVFGAMGTAMTEVSGAVQAFGAAWAANDGDVTSSGLPGFMERVAFFARSAFDYVRGTAIPALRDMVTWVRENSSWLLPLVGGLVAAAAAYKTVTSLMAAFRGVQLAVNLAMSLSPLGLIVAALAGLAAAVVLAYQKSETFRDIVQAGFAIVQGAFRAVGEAGQWLWATVLQPVFAALSTAWSALAAGISWAWNNLIKPVWDFIAAAAQVLFIAVAVAVFGPMLLAWKILSEGIKAAWTYVLQPVWNAVATAAQWLWTTVLQPVFGFIGLAWQALAAGVQWYWANVLQPVWNAVATAAQWLYDNVLAPVFSAIGAAWSALSTAMQSVYNSAIAPIFTWFGDVLGVIRDAFGTAVDWIGTVWDGLKSKLLAPVQFVVDVVWNNGLRKLWNTINNLWGGDDLPEFRLDGGGNAPTGAGTSGSGGPTMRLATGGVIPGYTPGRDVHRFVSPTGGRLDLSGGEAVMRPEWTRVLGTATIDRWNELARTQGEAGLRRVMSTPRTKGAKHGDPPSPQAYAEGGIISLPGWLDSTLSFVPGGGAVRDIIASINGGTGYAGGGWGEGLVGLVKTAGTKLWEAASGLFGGGAATGPAKAWSGAGGFSGALSWAQSQAGKPYVWGGVGPTGFDCSGFMSAITNVIRGLSPNRRIGATGSFPWSGFAPGAGPFTIGSSRNTGSGIGHMAGTLLGVNVESRGGEGVVVGPRARGANDRLFSQRAALFDDGGLWKHGVMGMNLTGGVERVLTPEQDRAFQRFSEVGAGLLDAAGARGPLIERVDLHAPDRETGYELIDQLIHKMQVKERGGVHTGSGS